MGLNDKKILFYTKNKNNLIYIYELEKDKLLNLFKESLKISNQKIQDFFSQIIQDDSEFRILIKTLINLLRKS